MIAGIIEILEENSELTTLIGEDRIFPMIVPEYEEDGSTKIVAPYLAVMLAAQATTLAKGEPTGPDFPLIQVNVHAPNYDDMEEISEAVRAALDNGGTWSTEAGYDFQQITFANAVDRPDLFNQDRPSYPRSVQFNAILKR